MHGHRRARGFTLLELLAALAVGAVLVAGLVRLTVDSIEDTRGIQAGSHQQQVAAAAAKYLSANYATLAATATATVPAKVTVAQLRSAGFLPTAHADTNAFGQTPCLLVLQPSAGKLEALLVTEGGPAPIDGKQLNYVAANAGPGAGFLPQQTPLIAQGAFGAWTIPAATLANYLSANCSGTPAGAGHLASSLFYDGSNPVDFVYRSAVSGKPELNRMTTPLHMAAVAVEDDTTDARCAAGDPSTQGRIAVDATGRVLSCQAGKWKRQGSAHWKDPVASFADLPATGNDVGDVRMATDVSRAFSWNGVGWLALAVDQNGDLSLPGTLTAGFLQVATTVEAGTPCAASGLVAKDAGGLLMSCQGGSWAPQASAQLGYTESNEVVIVKSDHVSYPGGTNFFSGTYHYDPSNCWTYADVSTVVTPTKDGQVIVNAKTSMARHLYNQSGLDGQVSLILYIYNRDTGDLVATNSSQVAAFTDTFVTTSTTLSKILPKTFFGYRVWLRTYWTTFTCSAAGNLYNRSNYQDTFGVIVESTPVKTAWTLDLSY